MKSTISVAVTGFLLIVTLASAGGAVYIYTKLDQKTTETTELKSENEDLEVEVSDLENTIDDVEEILVRDVNGDDLIADEPVDESGDPCDNTSSDGEIIVTKPCINDNIGSSFIIEGKARVFEATFMVSIVQGNGQVLFQKNYMTTGGDIGLKNPFDETVTWNSPGSGVGFISFYEHSAMDGSAEHVVTIPVTFE